MYETGIKYPYRSQYDVIFCRRSVNMQMKLPCNALKKSMGKTDFPDHEGPFSSLSDVQKGQGKPCTCNTFTIIVVASVQTRMAACLPVDRLNAHFAKDVDERRTKPFKTTLSTCVFSMTIFIKIL